MTSERATTQDGRGAPPERIEVQPQREDNLASFKPWQPEESKEERLPIHQTLEVRPGKFNSKWQANLIHRVGPSLFLLKAQSN